LDGRERRRPRGRHLAGRLSAARESVVDVPPKLSARVRVLSSFAGNARKNDGLEETLASGTMTSDLGGTATTDAMADAVVQRLRDHA